MQNLTFFSTLLYYVGFLRDGTEEGALPEQGQPGLSRGFDEHNQYLCPSEIWFGGIIKQEPESDMIFACLLMAILNSEVLTNCRVGSTLLLS